MSGKDEIPRGITFKDGIDFPSCRRCTEFQFWECYGAADIIYLNPKNYVKSYASSSFRAVVIYHTFDGLHMQGSYGRNPTIGEVAAIDKITCNKCRRTPNDEDKMDMIAKTVDYVVWINKKELNENVRN